MLPFAYIAHGLTHKFSFQNILRLSMFLPLYLRERPALWELNFIKSSFRPGIQRVPFLPAPLIYYYVLLRKVLVEGVPVWLDNAGFGGVLRSWFVDEGFNNGRSHQLHLHLLSGTRDGEDGLS